MRSPAGRCATAVLALAGVLVPAWAEPPDGDRVFTVLHTRLRAAPVVVLVFDELPLATLVAPDGDVDEELFPGFAALQERSTWYRNATASETFTKEARPALLTGSYPRRTLRTTFDYPKSLFALLGRSHEIRAADLPANVCPPGWCDEPVAGPPLEGFEAFGRGDKGRLVSAFLRELTPPDEPRLHLLHVVFPHGPWRYLPDGRRYYEIDPMPGEVDRRGRGTSWRKDPWPVTQAYQRHLLQAQLADKVLGAVMERLQATGLWDPSVLVVTADHGIGWVPGEPKRLPTENNAGTLAWVPFFVKAPGQSAGVVSDAPAQTVDLLPTVADHLRAEVWPDLDGISLVSEYPSHRKRHVVDHRLPRGLRPLREAVEDKHERLADGERSIRPWRVAPGRSEELASLTVEELAVGDASGVTFRAVALKHLANADPGGSTFPALFEGTLQGVEDGRRPLVAIAVNGKVTAVTRSYESYGLTWFGALLRPGAFTEREDVVRLFLVDDVSARAVSPLRITERPSR